MGETLTLHFRAYDDANLSDAAQTVAVRVNGSPQAMVALEPGWKEYTVPVSSAAIVLDALQQITLDHAWAAVPPGDTRHLAVAYDWFRLEVTAPQSSND